MVLFIQGVLGVLTVLGLVLGVRAVVWRDGRAALASALTGMLVMFGGAGSTALLLAMAFEAASSAPPELKQTQLAQGIAEAQRMTGLGLIGAVLVLPVSFAGFVRWLLSRGLEAGEDEDEPEGS